MKLQYTHIYVNKHLWVSFRSTYLFIFDSLNLGLFFRMITKTPRLLNKIFKIEEKQAAFRESRHLHVCDL